MRDDTPLLRSLRAAVAASPDDVPLRLHLAELLLDAGRLDESISHIAAALHRVPQSAAARALMARAMAAQPEATQPERVIRSDWAERFSRPESTDHMEHPKRTRPPVPARPQNRQQGGDEPTARHSFNWLAAEHQFVDVAQPYVDSGTAPLGAPILYDVETTKVRLADVVGMAEAKQRLAGMYAVREDAPRRPAGGLLLYGPPGCGKSFLARAVAGELGARFLPVSVGDALDTWAGSTDRRPRDLFAEVRRAAPCVLFLDGIDVFGHQRGNSAGGGAARTVLSQLLAELDAASGHEDVVVLAAASHPWRVDPALRRPGRLGRMLPVLPPDLADREAMLRYRLREATVSGADVRELAKRTEDFSGADLARLCEAALDRAGSGRSGKPRRLSLRDFDAVLGELRPSAGAWLSAARDVAVFGNTDGSYDELHRCLKRRRLV